MARISLLICLVTLVAFGFVLDSTSATFFLRGREDALKAKTAKAVMLYTSKHIMDFLASLEKTCPATMEFKALFQRFRSYVNVMCPVSALTESRMNFRDGILNSKSKELDGAFGFFLELFGGANGSGQMSLTLKKDHVAAIKALQDCQATIGKILIQHHVKNMGSTLTSEEVTEIEKAVTTLEQAFSSFVNAAVKIYQEYSAKGTGQSNSGSAEAPETGAKPSTPETAKNPATLGPKTAEDLQLYTSNQILNFLANLEKNCPATKEFKALFVKIREYVKDLCTQISGNAPLSSKLKELDDAFQVLLEAQSTAGISAQMTTSLKSDHKEVIGTLESLRAVISKIMEYHMKKTGSTELSSEEQAEVKNAMSKLEQVFSNFVNAAVKSYKEYSAKESGQSNSGSTNAPGKSRNGSTNGSTNAWRKRQSGSAPVTNDKSSTEAPQPAKKPSAEATQSSTKVFSKVPQMATKPSAPSSDASGTPKKPPVEAPETTKKPSTQAPETSKKSSTEAPKATKKPSAAGPQKAYKPSTKAPAATKKPTTEAPETTKKSSAEGPVTAKKPSLGDHAMVKQSPVEAPKSVKDLQLSISNQIINFLTNLEKNCAATNEFKSLFVKIKEYVKNMCVVSTLTQKSGDTTWTSKSKELNDAFEMLLGVQSKASGSGQMTMTLKNDHKEIMDALGSLEAVISKITEHHLKKTGSMELSSDEQTEIKNVMSKLEQVFSHFVKVAANGEGYSVKLTGQSRDGSMTFTAQSSREAALGKSKTVEVKGEASFQHGA